MGEDGRRFTAGRGFTMRETTQQLRRAAIVMSLAAVGGIPAEAQNLSSKSDDPTDPLINQGPKSEAIGQEAMVSTQTPAVTEAALEVLHEPERFASLGLAARQRILDDYSLDRVYPQLEALYERVASGSRPDSAGPDASTA